MYQYKYRGVGHWTTAESQYEWRQRNKCQQSCSCTQPGPRGSFNCKGERGFPGATGLPDVIHLIPTSPPNGSQSQSGYVVYETSGSYTFESSGSDKYESSGSDTDLIESWENREFVSSEAEVLAKLEKFYKIINYSWLLQFLD